jgi:hypothetical protein
VAALAKSAVDALTAAQIGPERRGRARLSGLSPTQSDLYRWILRQFAAAPPSAEATRAAARDLGLDPAEALAVFARDDLVHLDGEGRLQVAYPFSARDRGHRVLIDGLGEVQAMCAIDALGIAPMLDLPVEIVSRDPISRGEIRVQLRPGEPASWQPEEAVVIAGSACSDGPSFCGCCDVLNFFETAENAKRYLHEHPEIAGMPITIPEAAEAGRVVFGDVLRED